MLKKKDKESLIKKYKTHDTDTGSPEVQVAILTKEISELNDHLRGNKKDVSSRRGLLKKVTRRKKLMNYLAKTEPTRFETLSKSLKI